jgi:hypothetical protein
VRRKLSDLPYLDQETADAVSRAGLHRIDPTVYLTIAVRAGVSVRKVPEGIWAPCSLRESHYSAAAFRCACGTDQLVQVGVITSCQCDRLFLYGGTQVLALNSPMDLPPAD